MKRTFRSAARAATALLGVFAMTASLFAPTAAPQADAAVRDWHKGVSITSRWAEDFAGDGFKQSVRNAKDMGADYVTLIIPYIQSDIRSTDIRANWNAPSDATLGSAIDYIHSQGMKVSIKPHLEVSNGTWRALIEAPDRNTWYANYGAMINHLGDIGQSKGADMIVVGTELVSMASPYVHGDNTQRWQTIISSLRSRYSGLLTYSANWGRGDNWTNEFEKIGFWPSLDYIGISAYFEHWTDSSVSSLMNSWQTIDQNQIGPLQSRIGKPVLFTEVGYRSVDNAHSQPWNYEMGGNYNAQEQVNLYEALIRYWNGRSYFAGFSLWDWNSDPNYGGEGNTDYTPNDKPAENTIRSYFSGTTPTPDPDPNPDPGPAPAPTGDWSASAGTVSNPNTGSQITIPVTISITGEARNVIADLEIYNSQSSKIAQQFYEGQNISQGSPGQYSIAWTPPVAGRYTLKIGTFKSGWSQNYYWNDGLATIDVVDPGQNPPPDPEPGAYETDVWWPTNGVAISGSQPFKAMVQGKSVNEYTMFWQVDGRHLNLMSNSYIDYPHKEAQVDVSAFNWNGPGPYAVTFTSKDNTGATISQKTVNIEVR